MINSTQINEIIKALTNALFSAESKRLRKRELDLVAENRSLSSEHYDGFFYQGQFYTDLDRSLVAKGIKASGHVNRTQRPDTWAPQHATLSSN